MSLLEYRRHKKHHIYYITASNGPVTEQTNFTVKAFGDFVSILPKIDETNITNQSLETKNK